MHNAIKFVALVAVFLASLPAWAGGGPSDSVACGSAPAGWDVPNGSAAYNRGSGPVRAVIDAIGEYRTHSMLSHGPGQYAWMSHNTMFTPGTNDVCELCDNPMRTGELQDGYPGASQMNMGGLYTFLYAPPAAEYVSYQLGDPYSNVGAGAAIANWTWSSMPYQWVTSQKDANSSLYRLKWDSGNFMEYSLYSFRDTGSSEYGYEPWYHGNMCSGFLSYAQFKKFGWAFGVSKKTYPNWQIAYAAGQLQGTVQSECDNGLGFWSALGAGFTCFWCDLDTNVCDDAGRQVTYCMMYGDGSCHRGGDDLSVPDWMTATSISPDRVAGYNGHGYGQPGNYSGYSVWSYDYSHFPNWNQGGSRYGCWF